MNRLIFLIIIVTINGSEALVCYSCSYGETDAESLVRCANDTRWIKQQPKITCQENKICRVDILLDVHTNKVSSVRRTCEKHQQDICINDYTHRSCKRSCDTDLCNTMLDVEFYQTNNINSAVSLCTNVLSIISIFHGFI